MTSTALQMAPSERTACLIGHDRVAKADNPKSPEGRGRSGTGHEINHGWRTYLPTAPETIRLDDGPLAPMVYSAPSRCFFYLLGVPVSAWLWRLGCGGDDTSAGKRRVRMGCILRDTKDHEPSGEAAGACLLRCPIGGDATRPAQERDRLAASPCVHIVGPAPTPAVPPSLPC